MWMSARYVKEHVNTELVARLAKEMNVGPRRVVTNTKQIGLDVHKRQLQRIRMGCATSRASRSGSVVWILFLKTDAFASSCDVTRFCCHIIPSYAVCKHFTFGRWKPSAVLGKSGRLHVRGRTPRNAQLQSTRAACWTTLSGLFDNGRSICTCDSLVRLGVTEEEAGT